MTEIIFCRNFPEEIKCLHVTRPPEITAVSVRPEEETMIAGSRGRTSSILLACLLAGVVLYFDCEGILTLFVQQSVSSIFLY